ncbi:MAG: iron chaperone [Candidatus Dormibacteria bacterium]
MQYATIDQYLATLDEPKRSTLQRLREDIRSLVPDAEECISYGMPAFRVRGKVVAGFAAFTNHLSYLPHSGSVLPALGDDLAGYGGTKSSLHFRADQSLPAALVEQLISARLLQIPAVGVARRRRAG